MEEYVQKRVVLTAHNDLSFAGTFREVFVTADGQECAIVELDRSSGFAIACPLSFIKEVLVVPITVSDSSSRSRANPIPPAIQSN